MRYNTSSKEIDEFISPIDLKRTQIRLQSKALAMDAPYVNIIAMARAKISTVGNERKENREYYSN